MKNSRWIRKSEALKLIRRKAGVTLTHAKVLFNRWNFTPYWGYKYDSLLIGAMAWEWRHGYK